MKHRRGLARCSPLARSPLARSPPRPRRAPRHTSRVGRACHKGDLASDWHSKTIGGSCVEHQTNMWLSASRLLSSSFSDRQWVRSSDGEL
jgi:hypothetical protein